MGRKIGGLFFNPKKRRIAAKPCMQEMISFLSCLSQNQMNDEKCLHSKELLKTCLDDEVGDDAICILLLYNRLRVNFFEECIVCFHREIVFLLIVWFFYFLKIEFIISLDFDLHYADCEKQKERGKHELPLTEA